MTPLEPIEFGSSSRSERLPVVADPVTPAVLAELATGCAIETDPAALAEHGRDWWPLAMHWALAGRTPSLPQVVARPTSTEQVAHVVRVAAAHGLAVVAGGGRSGVCGGVVPLAGGVSLDMTAMRGVEEIDTESGLVCALAGTFGPELEAACAARGLTVGHRPQSFDISTVGGWIAAGGAGQYSTRYGPIAELVAGLEVVLASGEVVRTGGHPHAAVGPDLTAMFVGSEGTLGVVTRAWLRARPLPAAERRAAWTFPSFDAGVAACRAAVRAGATPAVLRLYDERESRRGHGGDGSNCALISLDEGEPAIVEATLGVLAAAARDAGGLDASPSHVDAWLEHRNDTSGLQTLTRRGFVVDTMEVAAPWSRLAAVRAAVGESVSDLAGLRNVSCHLSHSYLDGACLYFTLVVEPVGDPEAAYVELWDRAQSAAIGAGASLAHHHGVGMSRARFVADALGPGLGVLRALKDALDPNDVCNPGKLGLPSRRRTARWP
jgi:alkyldihydroxyacetonephosphate synthase